MSEVAATLLGAGVGVIGTVLGGVITWLSQKGDRTNTNRREDHRRWEQPVVDLGVEMLARIDELISFASVVLQYGVDERGEDMLDSASAAYDSLGSAARIGDI